MLISHPRIIDVERKPRKCPVCGGSIVDIIYGTGDMTEVEFLLKYHRQGMMGGDNIYSPSFANLGMFLWL